MHIHPKEDSHGFTLLEILVAMLIFGMLTTFVAGYFINQNGYYENEINKTELRQDIRASMDIIVRELRMAGYDPAGSGLWGVPFNTSRLQIRADLNGDGDNTDDNESIDYYFVPGEKRIYRSTGGADEVLIENVENFSFSYKDANGNVITSSAQQSLIRQIILSITARTRVPNYTVETNSGYQTATCESMVTPRNLSL